MSFVSFLWVSSAFILARCAGLPKRVFYADLDSAPSYMLEGYYKNPSFSQNYYPGSLSAVVTKDVVATNSFAGQPQYYHLLQDDSKEDYTEKNPVGQNNIPNRTPELSLEEDSKGDSSTQDNRNIPTSSRRGRKPHRPNEDEEEEEDSPWPFAKSGPSYTSFFPINISGGGGGGGGLRHRTRNTEGGQDDVPYSPSGSATAIANAFSTGKGGIATSRATSFGDPYLAAMLLRNGMGNVKSYREY